MQYGTKIDGGTFNNVSGNMSQVLNSHVVRIEAPTHPPLVPRVLPIGSSSFGAIRGRQDGLRRAATHPYASLSHQHQNHAQQIEFPESGSVYSDNVEPRYPAAQPYAIASRGQQNQSHEIELPNCNGTYSADVGNTMRRRSSYERAARSEALFPVSPAQVMPYPPTNLHSAGSNIDDISNTFNNVAGDMTQLNVTSYGESGLDILYRHVAMEAVHDSSERFAEPACHPGTRTAVLEQLASWSIDTSSESTVMWLHGSAGMGKSAIAQMFAGQCQAQGRLGASFFFKRGHPTRGSWHRLLTTIGYQLANWSSELLVPIQQAVEQDKLLVARAISLQFRKLLLEPFQRTSRLHSIPVIIIDGLDECADHNIQQQILRLWTAAIRSHQLSIRLLIVSRPEPHIGEVFETEENLSICHHLDFPTDKSARDDIGTYFRDEFSRIRSDYLSRGIDLGTVWPDPAAVEQLVHRSSGIFIYATTVIRFIDDEYSHPVDRLASVLEMDPRSTVPLDDLYTQILSAIPHAPQQLRILHAIWRRELDFQYIIDPEDIDMILGLRPATCRLALRALHSLFDVPRIRGRFTCLPCVRCLHASLSDYLEDTRRSGRWCVVVPWLQLDHLESVLRLLSSPALTRQAELLNRTLVCHLPLLLENISPSHALITLLRNEQFHKSLFTTPIYDYDWPSSRGTRATQQI
ncbi:hypothetical protein C8F04DRAFT_643916 [Mycena alexandri]|uniref:Nephrocystin 3-like N-terminal domain-containing protein n=1 Tax=Mycena alexandri TaxID=1745969 RepID=A0AAD6TDF6_9AGAR|nr:hypothetical protein C8F04DRAFT_643916 [Mycena alexandri]